MKIQLENKIYDVLKWVAIIGIPALSVLVIALSQLWGWDYAPQIVGTLDAIAVFIGAIIGISTKNYVDTKEKK